LTVRQAEIGLHATAACVSGALCHSQVLQWNSSIKNIVGPAARMCHEYKYGNTLAFVFVALQLVDNSIGFCLPILGYDIRAAPIANRHVGHTAGVVA
jgi:hypothetical protein